MMSCLSPRLEVSLFLWLLRISKMHQLVASLTCPLQDIREVSLSKVEAVNKYFSLFFLAFAALCQNRQRGLVRDQKSLRATRRGDLVCPTEDGD